MVGLTGVSPFRSRARIDDGVKDVDGEIVG